MPFGQVTNVGMRILGVFAGCIFVWIVGYVGWGSVLGLLMLSLYVPNNTVNSVFATYGSFNMMVLVWCMLFCYCLQKLGVLGWVSEKLLSLKWASKSPWHICVTMWLMATACSALVGNSAAAAILTWNIFYQIADNIGIKHRSIFCGFVIVTIGTFAAISMTLVPYSSSLWFPITLMMAVAPNLQVPILKVCLLSWILIVFLFVVLGITAKLLLISSKCRNELDGINMEKASATIGKKIKMTKGVKWGFFYIGLVLVMMIIPSVFTGAAITGTLNRLGVVGAFAVAVVLMCITTIDGERMVKVEDAMKYGVPWGIYFMFATAMAVAGQAMGENAGITATIMTFVQSTVSDASPYVMVMILLGIGLILTNCINNAIAIQLLTPICTVVLLNIGVNPVILVGFVGLVLDHGNILPSGSPLAALMHGNTEWIKPQQVYLWATIGSLAVYLGLAAVLPVAFALL